MLIRNYCLHKTCEISFLSKHFRTTGPPDEVQRFQIVIFNLKSIHFMVLYQTIKFSIRPSGGTHTKYLKQNLSNYQKIHLAQVLL